MPVPAKAFVGLRVEEFELDLRSREMRRNGEKIKLQGRPFQILTELVQRPGEVVSREEIRRQLWPNDTFVDFEHSINTAINKLREAFGDDAENPRFIETLPRVGYRFIARVENVGTEAATLPTATDQREVPLTDSKRWQRIAVAGVIGALLAIATLSLLSSSGPRKNPETQNNVWTHITDFNDSATSPALSRDGRMIAFIRGPETFVTLGQIYVKMLPDGQPVQLTHDDAPKMAPTFSPDGTRIAYTANDKKWGWNTWVVPVLGAESQKNCYPMPLH